ncbi:DNA-binding protein [Candidatus Pacearchaeota archaeon CG10_big_fil_rev_8_21_14_0_10_34_76]|nr:MAG: DNA-binding protein [Candidatus Pacearchaeota archaeon CG10_big_fil_rev_8_21_14_0_10_34_76]
MKDLDFLTKLKNEKKLELLEPSESLAESYERKSRDCLISAKILMKNNLFENAIGEAYYSIYNSIQSLFFKCGIKCENHSASVLILKYIFQLDRLYSLSSKAKEERIDKQYYTITTQTNPATKESAQDLISIGEKFILEINDYKRNLKIKDINKIRGKFQEI